MKIWIIFWQSSELLTTITLSSRPASVAQVTETQCVLTGTVCRKEPVSIPGSAGGFRVRILAAHASRLIYQAGKTKEGSTVSSIICNR